MEISVLVPRPGAGVGNVVVGSVDPAQVRAVGPDLGEVALCSFFGGLRRDAQERGQLVGRDEFYRQQRHSDGGLVRRGQDGSEPAPP